MKTKEEAIEAIKHIMEKNKDIRLTLATDDVAGWVTTDKELDITASRDVGRISALSWGFGITPKDLELKE